MVYRVVIPPHVERRITKVPPALKRKIRAALDDLALDPSQGKSLKEELKGLYSYRVARYRIIYSIHDDILEIHVIAIGPRKTIYQSAFE